MDTNAEARRFPAERVHRFVYESILKAGTVEEVAQLTARGLWQASLRGVDSHGIRLLPHYLAGLEGGRINPDPSVRFEQTAPATGALDADHTFGHAAGMWATRHAIELSRSAGCGFVAVRNSSHTGAMAYFALEACNHDMIGLAFTNASPKMRSANGVRPFFGTNPICFTAPMLNEGPFCFDSAPTPMAMNKIRVYGEEGKTIPPGCGADEHGVESCDPKLVHQVLPIGDYKGFGLAMMVDILCAALTGMPAGDRVTQMFTEPMSAKRYLGQFVGAIRIDAFEDPKRFKVRLQETADRLRKEPRADPNTPVLVPGDPEKAFEADRTANGMPVRERELKQFTEIATRLGIEPL